MATLLLKQWALLAVKENSLKRPFVGVLTLVYSLLLAFTTRAW